MWSLLSRKWQVTLIVAAGVILAWSVDAIWSIAFKESAGLVKVVSLAVAGITTVGAFALERSWRRVWERFPWLGQRTFPDLNGVWKGTLISTWTDPESEMAPDPISVEITIRQGLFSTHVSLATNESKSHSTRCILEPVYDTRRYRIWYSYSNEPRAQMRHRSAPHEGVAYLELDVGEHPTRLTGRYYTARKTTGDISVKRL